MHNFIALLLLITSSLGHCQTKVEQIPLGSIEDNFIGGRIGYHNVFLNYVDYPKVLKKDGIVGTVYYMVQIDTSGCITDLEILRGVSPLMDAEVQKEIYITEGHWKPLWREERKVNYRIVERVYFELR